MFDVVEGGVTFPSNRYRRETFSIQGSLHRQVWETIQLVIRNASGENVDVEVLMSEVIGLVGSLPILCSTFKVKKCRVLYFKMNHSMMIMKAVMIWWC